MEEIENMLPHELEQVKKLVDDLLQIEISQRRTNIEYVKSNKIGKCPVDNNHKIKKNGTKNGCQRYWCYQCQKSFSITDKTIIKYSKLTYDQIVKILKGLYLYTPIREIAYETRTSKTTVFEFEIKLFEALEQINKDIVLSGIVQADEQYIRISFKGTKTEKMPRPSKDSGYALQSGTSFEQICVIVAIDSNDNMLIKTSGTGTGSIEKITNALKGKIQPGSVLVTDSKNAYQQFADENNLDLIQIPSGYHKIGDYTINDVNEIMTEITTYLEMKRGISSRHLQHHLNFLRYRKIIKYTYEYLEINRNMYLNAITLISNLKSNDVYSTPLPFDLNDYIDWYNNLKK